MVPCMLKKETVIPTTSIHCKQNIIINSRYVPKFISMLMVSHKLMLRIFNYKADFSTDKKNDFLNMGTMRILIKKKT